ncbi:MAG: O-antigen ligase family protein [Patescibacteria group bacterium]|nr:O-antigen ligase family protein [Patescibacteria group bacterium]
MNRKKLEFVIKALIYVSFFVPLIVIPSSFIFPFIVPKIVVFRSLVEIMLGAYILLLIINWQEYKPRFTPLTAAVVAFYVISFGISTFVGADAYHSFWDNHERMLGFYTILHYFVFYLLASQFFKTWTDWKWLLRVLLLAGSLVMFVGALQIANPDLLLNGGSGRVGSTLGNPIYVGGYGLFLLFLAFLLFVKDKNRIWQGIYLFLMFFAFLGLLYSGTRGAVLGLLAGVGACIFTYALALRGHPKTRYSLFGLMILVVLIVGLLYNYRKTDFVSNMPAVGRAVNTSWTDVKATPRWVAWEIAWESFLQRPFFGWGPNNYFYAFNYNYTARSLDFGYSETWFDNAHNIVMNTLAVQGAVGFLTYFALFIVAAIALIQAYRRERIDVHLLAIGCGFLAAHFVSNLTVFENITSYLYFMCWLAMINQLTTDKEQIAGNEKNKNYKTEPNERISLGAVCTVGLLTFIVILIFNIQPARANMATLDAIKTLSLNPSASLEKMKIAVSVGSPHIDDIRSDLSRSAVQMLYAAEKQKSLNNEIIKSVLDFCYAELNKNTILHPLDVRNYLNLYQLAQFKAYIENNQLYVQESENYLRQALVNSPHRQQIIYALAMLDTQINKPDEAVSLLLQTIADNPRPGEGYWRLAYIYQLTGQPEKIPSVWTLADKNKAVFTDQDKDYINQIFPNGTSTAAAATKK